MRIVAKILSGKAAAVSLSLFFLSSAEAQNFPDRAIKIVVPSPPGTQADVLARALSKPLSAQLKQPVFVENKIGGGGFIGTAAVARAAPDGYTLLLTTGATLYSNLFLKDQSVVPSRDLAPVAPVGVQPDGLMMSTKVPVKSLPEFVAYAKANPGKLVQGIYPNSTLYLDSLRFTKAVGLDFLEVPFSNPLDLGLAMARGDVHFYLGSPATAQPQIDAGLIHLLATTGATRTSQSPSIPTARELGYDFVTVAWFGLLYPVAVQKDLVDRMYHETLDATDTPELKQLLARLGYEPMHDTLEQLRKTINDDAMRYEQQATELKIEKQ